jgi:PAS domain S-box-containing protein
MDLSTRTLLNPSLQLQAIFQAFPDLLFVMSGDGRILDYKAGNPALLHASPGEFLNRRMPETLPSGVGEQVDQAIKKVMRSGQPTGVNYHLSLRDGEHWFESRFVPVERDQVIAIVRDITDYKQTEERIQSHLERLAALRTIDRAITSSLDLKLTLTMLLGQVTAQLDVDAADILLFNPHTQALEYAAGHGFRTTALQYTHLRLGEGYAGQAALERRTIQVQNLPGHVAIDFLNSPFLVEEAFQSYYGVPLLAKGEVCGVLEVFDRRLFEPDVDWLDFLETLAGQAAIAVENAMLFKDLQRSNSELTMAYDATIEGWSRALDLRDKETEGHTQRVTETSIELARRMGIDAGELIHIRRGAMLHDIGKMGIPDRILLKPGPLTDDEWQIMRQHPRYAHELLAPIAYLTSALDIPLYHHERWDGSGYPHGLKEEQIPLSARIFAVADVYDALTSDRPYRPARSHEEAIEYIRDQRGRHFDPKVVESFLGMISKGDWAKASL